MTDCPAFVPHLNDQAARACGPENALVNEDIGETGPLDRLPGNNPLWVGTGPKPSFDNVAQVPDFINTTIPLPQGWADLGCHAEPKGTRALTAATMTSDTMTRNACMGECGQA